jgi:predicted metal-dependent hydrolase
MGSWCHEPPPRLLLSGVAQFNRGEFFAQHETLEDLWREETRDVRRLYQGILQIGVSLYHIQRLNHHGAVYMLTRGTSYLRPFSPICQSVDVADLLTQSSKVLSAVQQLGKDRLWQFDWSLSPRVHLVDSPPVGH